MKTRRVIFRVLALVVLSTGALVLFPNQNVKADLSCWVTGETCRSVCALSYPQDNPELPRCMSRCNANQVACYANNEWQSWLQQFDNNITDDFFLIQDGPDPSCAYYPQYIVDCGNLPTAEEIEACVLMIQQEQAKFHCP